MTRMLHVVSAGPGMSIQDIGRRGTMVYGVSRGGVADLAALHEGAALLGQAPGGAVLEMVGMGGTFRAEGDLRVALTGAPMRASIDDAPVAWHASHALKEGQVLKIGPATSGVYGYLSVGGGFDTPLFLGSRATQPSAGIGRAIAAGDALPVGPDKSALSGQVLDVADRFGGGAIRIVPSIQTDRFSAEDRARFEQTLFRRDSRGNRQGVKMTFEGPPFRARDQLNVLSEIILQGDIQMTGEGEPFVLLPDSQTTGGYPRIGTVIPPDLPRMVQAAPGADITFVFVSLEDATKTHRAWSADLAALSKAVRPLVRDPATMRDLLSYSLVSGVTDGETFR